MKTQIAKLNTFSPGVTINTSFCVSQDGDEVFMPGGRGSDDKQVILRYNRTGQLLNKWKVKCIHSDYQHLLHLSIGGTPYIAMSCLKCDTMSLYSITNSDPIKAWKREDFISPYAMCHGPNNTILASNMVPGCKEVLVYDVRSTQFTLKDRIPVDVDQAYDIHYMDTDQHGGIVIVSRWLGKVMSAHRIESKTLVWKIEKREIDGKVFEPHGICFDPDNGALYVGDRGKERLIVIEPNTGDVIQSLQVPGVEAIWDLAWRHEQPHIVIHHSGNQITYINMD